MSLPRVATQCRRRYWLQSIRELVRDFPEQVTIASIMAAYNEEDWRSLAINACEAGA